MILIINLLFQLLWYHRIFVFTLTFNQSYFVRRQWILSSLPLGPLLAVSLGLVDPFRHILTMSLHGSLYSHSLLFLFDGVEAQPHVPEGGEGLGVGESIRTVWSFRVLRTLDVVGGNLRWSTHMLIWWRHGIVVGLELHAIGQIHLLTIPLLKLRVCPISR